MEMILFSDSHINSDYFEELNLVFEEIYNYEYEYLIFLGDLFDKEKPSLEEVLFASEWINKFSKKFKKVVLLRGNHDDRGTASWVDLYKYKCEIFDEYVYGNEKKIFFGHFSTNKSKIRDNKYNLKELETKYDLIFLGHQHSFQKLSNKAYHIGSCRRVTFNEADNDCYLIILDPDKLKFKQVKINSAFPMFKLEPKELTVDNLNKFDKNSKIYCVFNSYDDFEKKIDEIKKYKEHFRFFKYKIEIPINSSNLEANNNTILKQNIFSKFLETIDNQEVKTLILEEFKKEGLIDEFQKNKIN